MTGERPESSSGVVRCDPTKTRKAAKKICVARRRGRRKRGDEKKNRVGTAFVRQMLGRWAKIGLASGDLRNEAYLLELLNGTLVDTTALVDQVTSL